MRGILVMLLAALISGAATAMPQIRNGQVVITDDPGGEIYAFADRWDRIGAKGVPVKIDGRCSSSCTMGLSNPNVCVTPRAQFDFHLAYTTGMLKTKDGRWIEDGGYWDREASEQILLPRYPAWVKAWLTAHGGLSSRMKTMPYSYAKRFIRTCRQGGAHHTIPSGTY